MYQIDTCYWSPRPENKEYYQWSNISGEVKQFQIVRKDESVHRGRGIIDGIPVEVMRSLIFINEMYLLRACKSALLSFDVGNFLFTCLENSILVY